MVYLILLVSCLALVLIPGRKNQIKVMPFLLLMMIFICGMRAPEVGRDTKNYIDIFLSGGGRAGMYEPIFQLVADFTKWIGLGPNGFFTVMACITFIPLFWFFYKTSRLPVFSILIFLTFSVVFFHQTMNTVRASAALPFCLMAFFHANKKQWKPTVLYFLVATGFHYSSLVLAAILLLALMLKNLKREVFYVVLAVTLLTGLFLTSRIGAAIGRLTNAMVSLALFSKGTGYYVAQNYMASLEGTSLNFFGVAGTLLPFSAYAFLLYDKENRDSLYYKLFVLGVFISNVFLSVAIVYRVTMFLTPLITVILPNTYKRSKPKKQAMLLGLSILMILWYCYQMLTAGPDDMAGTVPYRAYWMTS